MEENIESKPEKVILSDKEIFIKIWTSPRQVFRFINDNGYDRHVVYLLVFSGILKAFDRALERNMGDHRSLWTIVLTSVILGGILGCMSLYIYAALVSWTGKWLKAKGNTNALLTIFSYAMIPSIVALIFLFLRIAIYGNDVFKSNDNILHFNLISNLIFYSILALELILEIWTIFLFITGISEVQKLSIGRSILNLLLPLFVILIPIFTIALLFESFK